MKQAKLLFRSILAMSICFMLGACSNDDQLDIEQEIVDGQTSLKTMKMDFIGGIVGYDQHSNAPSSQTRGTTSSWSDGDFVYITFYNGSTIIPGLATYNTSSGWSVSYDGDLATGSELKCEVRFFVNPTQATQFVVTLSENSEIYEDLDAKYTYNNGALTVQANLVPKTGRIRFTGTSETQIYLKGITYYSSFTTTNNTFYTKETMVKTQVQNNGSTPYIYGYFTEDDRRIGLIGEDYAFTRLCTSDNLVAGESGYMAIPTESSHSNWRTGLYVMVSGVEFKMIPVAGCSEGFFLIAETETTEALYKSVFGTNSSSTKPICSITYRDILSFIDNLNTLTNLSFKLPSINQWQYAAKGGNNSLDNTYAGSNSLEDVAWFLDNSSGQKHDVKQKAPNELGLYDMSGNVTEATSSLGSQYSNISGVYYRRSCGGSYISVASLCENESWQGDLRYSYDKTGYDNSSPTSGFRLILTCE